MSAPNPSIARRQIRLAAAGFMALGIAATAFDLLSRNGQQIRYVLGAVLLTGLSALTFQMARD